MQAYYCLLVHITNSKTDSVALECSVRALPSLVLLRIQIVDSPGERLPLPTRAYTRSHRANDWGCASCNEHVLRD
jgi:hypothetical protein